MIRAVFGIGWLSSAVFAATFVLRVTFLGNVKPISWDYTPPSDLALDAAFLLLSIQNVAAVVAAIALVSACVLWLTRRSGVRA